MAFTELKIYPSGFLGSSVVPMVEESAVQAVRQRLFGTVVNSDTPAFSANRDVSILWKEVISGTPDFKGFDFKERILRAAVAAFGTKTIGAWVEAQHRSEYHTPYHQSWIEETLNYVLSSKPRAYPWSVWFPLMRCGQGEPIKGTSMAVRRILEESAEARSMSVEDFIVLWCRQPDGVNDLIASLNIVFGKR